MQPKLLIDGEDEREFVNFYFEFNSANGIYIIDSETMGVIIHGSDFILKFDNKLFEQIKNIVSLKNAIGRN